MITIFFRTLIVYILLILTMRLMGKRQIGELEVSELVTTLLISEIASLPIENSELPLVYAVIPIITLLFIEVASSTLLVRLPFLKSLFSSRPTVLVRNGRPIRKELLRARISVEELISALRQKDVTDVADVDYAILEPNGQLSVLKRQSAQPPSAEALHCAVKECGITHILIANGHRDTHNVRSIPGGKNLVKKALKKENCRARDVFLMLVDDLGKVTVIRKKDAPKKGDAR